MAILHLVFTLLFDDDVAVRYTAMGLYREFMLKRNLRSLFFVDLAAQTAGGGAGASGSDFKADLFTGGFDRLIVDPDNKTSLTKDQVNPTVFEGFQAYLVRLLPQFKAYVCLCCPLCRVLPRYCCDPAPVRS